MDRSKSYNPYDWYITDEDYDEAKNHGVSKGLLRDRIRRHGWGKRKAIITPPRAIKKFNPVLKSLAKSNGISENALSHRIRRGWDEQRAATTTIKEALEQRDRKCAIQLGKMNRKYPIELLELAARSGISYACFIGRMKLKWDYIKAATIPPIKGADRGKRLKELYGEDFFKKIKARLSDSDFT
ncbi:hypothetical protein [Paenibacillus thermotolerans]|uniref:hypothetical protein n=1 Tax=Paenibacillus thermotolerans TaxID=3027807 RepID=UPI002368A9A6|nr:MULTISPECIES: hypothetical protein [unclassified Paenibacillus]